LAALAAVSILFSKLLRVFIEAVLKQFFEDPRKQKIDKMTIKKNLKLSRMTD
jgi:hypothetical protein